MQPFSLTQHASASRGVRFSWLSWLGVLILLCLSMVRPAYADTCTAFVLPNAQTTPSTSPMASGGTITLDLSIACYLFGPQAFNITTAHGQASGTGIDELITYTNNGDGALVDSFTFPNPDNSAQTVTVTVNIAPASSPLTISPSTLTAGAVGALYSQSFSTSGGTAPYTYSLTGTLPAGMSFSGDTLSGTPTAQGSFSLSLRATDALAVTTTKSYTLTVQAPTISLSSLPSPTRGASYNQTIVASGGTAPYTFTLESGTLPAGLSLSSAGVVSGTPTTLGTSNFQVRATDSSTPNSFKLQSYALTVADAVTYAPTSPTGGTVGVAYSQSLASASGGTAPYTYTVASGALPAGLTLAANGTLSGTPTAGGTFNFAVKATDSGGSLSATSSTLTLTIAVPTIAVSPTSLPAPTVGSAYGPQTITASGGTASYTYAITSGALPAGLALASNGTLSGTPTAGGSFIYTVTATDSSTGTGPYTGSRAYLMTVAAPTLSLSPIGGSLSGSFGTPFSQAFTASGGTSTYSYALTINTGTMPAGLSFSTATGVLSGTPSAAGTVSFTITATDSSTGTGPYSTNRSYTLTVAAPTIAVSPTTLPAPTVGTAYSQTITASGGTTPYTYAVTSGALPAGLGLASNGTLSGTPTAGGSFIFNVVATDSSVGTQYTGSRAYVMTVAAPTLSLSPVGGSLNGSFGTPFTQAFSASGGTPNYTYALTVNSGTMPAGLSFSTATGVLSGTPTTAGTVSFTVSATDSSTGTGPYSTSQAYTLSVAAPTIALTPSSLPGANVGAGYSQTLSASGGTAPYTYALVSGSLPAGLSLNAVTGSISGTPTAGGTFPIQVRATDSNSFSSSNQSYSLVVGAPVLALNPGSGASFSGTGGVALSESFAASGGTPTYSYALTVNTGTMPSGLSFSSATGVLSGTPTTAGTVNFTVTATDSSTGTGAPYSVQGSYTLTVAAPTLGLSPGSLPAPLLGTAYSQTVTASGGVTPYTYALVSGSLPTGLSLNATSGAISGTTTEVGAYSFTVQATDVHGFAISQAYSFSVAPPTVVISTASLANGQIGSSYSQTIIATGGLAPYTYAVTGGTLPAGLSLNSSSGSLSGTPTTEGSYSFTVTATDSATGTGAPFTGQHNYTVVIAPLTPIAGNDSATTAFGAPVTINLATVITGGAATSVAVASPPSHGTVTVSGTSVTYTPASGYAGSDSFTYTASNSGGTSSPGTVTVNVQQQPPIAGNDSATTAFGAPVTINLATVITGGVATGVAVATNPSHGTVTVSGTSVTYTPASGYAGSDSFTYTASNSGGTSAPGTVTVNVQQQPPIAGNDSATTAFGAPVTINLATVITGGVATGVAVATNPSHGTATVSGTSVTYTPASGYAGSDSFTYTASNSGGTSSPGTVTINVQQQPPIAGAVAASMPANSADTPIVLHLSGGPATAVAVASAPSHGNASVSGMTLSYTPATNYFGQDSLTYTATGPGGTSAPATVTITVAPLAVPTAVTQNASVLAGKSMTIHATAGASGGPFTAVAIVSPPGSGSAQVSGTDIVFTAAADSPATVDFTYSVANAFGVSAPASVVVTVNPLPVAASSHVSAVAGVAVQVNLNTGASGGPFTAAALLGMTPANAGQASISRNGAGEFILAFVPAMTSSGTATINFTLSNAYATSAPGTITVAITPRSDPSRDPEVLGLLNSQADATRRFATAQIANFQQRLESLHQGAVGAFSNQLSFSSASDRHRALAQGQPGDLDDPMRRYLIDPNEPVPAQRAPGNAGEEPAYWSVWTGGAVNFGSTDRNRSSRGEDFTTSGVSVGADHAFSPELAAGAGIGYSHDSTDIGHNGTRNRGDGYSAALYASYHPETAIYVDALIGYQRLSFDSRRYVTDNGNLVNGSRDGHQWFGSLAAGYDYRRGELSISPYLRLDLARASLDAYSERGDAIYALDYHRQTVKTSTSSLGVHLDYRQQTRWGVFAPRLRLEYEHDFQGAGQAMISYSDLIGGPLYSAKLSQYGQDRGLIGLGAALQTPGAWIIRVEYQYQFSSGSLDGQSILLNLNKSF